jgi:hypothetical protein
MHKNITRLALIGRGGGVIKPDQCVSLLAILVIGFIIEPRAVSPRPIPVLLRKLRLLSSIEIWFSSSMLNS